MKYAAMPLAFRRIPWWLACALLGLLSLATVGPTYLGHDDAWYLHMAQVLLHGGTIYRDVVDTNPPLIVFLSLPPVWLAERLGIGATGTFKACVFCAEAVSIFVCARLLRLAWSGGSETTRDVLLASVAFALVPFARPEEFGQREHLMMLLVLPYLIAAVAPAQGRELRGPAAFAIGVAGGLGFAMKPHYVLAWLAIETTLLLVSHAGRGYAHSWRRREALGAAAVLACYALAVLLFVPQYLVLANKVRQVYGGLNASAALLFRLRDAQLWAAGLLALVLIRLPRASRSACVLLFIAWSAFLLAAILQLKGWNYHLYPARACALLFFVAFVLALFEAVPALGAVLRGGMRGIAFGIVAALLVSAGRYLLEARRPVVDTDLVTPLVRLIEADAPRGTVAVLSMRTIIYPAFPAVNYAGARWTMRHNSLWFLPGLYEKELQAADGVVPFRAPGAMPRLERDFYEEVIGDLCAAPPDLLLVERADPRAPGGRRALDLAAYYSQDGRYARLARGYEPLTVLGPFSVFKRTAGASCSRAP